MTRIVCLLGPTASGKTALACQWVERWGGHIISADSAQVYRHLDIGTAKPSLPLRQLYPHHLVDVRDPDQHFSAGDFAREAEVLITQLQPGPIFVVGGTFLYVRALLRPFHPMPDTDPAIRQRLAQQGQELGWAALHQRLAEVDPPTAARLHPHDAQRISRALEVWEASGRSLSQWQQASAAVPGFDSLSVGLNLSGPQALAERLQRRLDDMFAAGWLDEVAQLQRLYPDLNRDHLALRALGYHDIWQYLRGHGPDLAALKAKLQRQSLLLVKHQLTWLKSWPQLHSVDALNPQALANITEEVGRFLEQ